MGTSHHTILTIAYQQAKFTALEDKPLNATTIQGSVYLMPIYFFAVLVASFIPLGFLAGNPLNDQIYGSIHYAACVLFVIIVMVNTELAFRPLLKQIEDASRNRPGDEDLKHARMLLSQSIFQSRTTGFLNTILNLLMASVPLLLRKVSYQMPITWIFIAFALFETFKHIGAAHKATAGVAGVASDPSPSQEIGAQNGTERRGAGGITTTTRTTNEVSPYGKQSGSVTSFSTANQ